ncbi:MAG: hypothetical protein ACRDCB_10230 [Clostridium sp.]
MTENIKETIKENKLNLKERKVVLDSASVFVVEDNFDLNKFDINKLATNCIGLTQGGADFKAKPKIKEVKFDGAMGRKVKGTKRITGWDVSVDINALEMLDNIFTLSMLERKSDSINSFSDFIPVEGIIGEEYYKNILIVGKTTDQKEALIYVKDAINNEGFNLKTEDEKEGVCKLKLEGHYSLDSNLQTLEKPFSVRIFN